MKKITIITATYQSESTLLDTLESINSQSYSDIEHIIIDGASRDRTLDIVKSSGKRVTKVISEKDKGIYDAYNKGLDQASGEIIGFLNSDDFYCSERVIEKVMAIFDDETVDICYADLVYVDRKNTSKISRHWKSKAYTAGMLKNAFIPAHPTLFIKRSVYNQVGGFNLSYRLAADYEFMARVFEDVNIKSVYIPEILVKMRDGGATGESVSTIFEQNKEILAALENHGVKIYFLNFIFRKIVDRIMQRVRGFFLNISTNRL